MNSTDYRIAIDKLRGLLAEAIKSDLNFQSITSDREKVLGRYQPVFNIKFLNELSAEQFKSFLLFENNGHWNGIHRHGGRICSDMDRLKKLLAVLLDEKRPLAQRVDEVSDAAIGMGKAIITAILLVSSPEKYGVWNTVSEGALKTLKIWPEWQRGVSFGEQYESVNQLLNQISKDLQIDLWTLDALLWRVDASGGEKEIMLPVESQSVGLGKSTVQNTEQRFGLERHLHDFLRDNWNKTELGKEWELYSEQGEPEAGYEYPTDIGRIDLLTKHRKEPRWLIVELKRAQSSDDTVGQVLRYMGWVRKHLAGTGDEVEGLIIAHEADESLRYAISDVPKIKFLIYEVSFRLRADSPPAD